MSQFIKPYNDDPFVGNLATPVSTSSFTRSLLGNLPAYRPGISPLFRGLEIGMTHGYFLVGPFYKLGPLAIYGVVSFEDSEVSDQLQSSKGWKQFTSGWLVGAVGGASFAFVLLSNVPMF